jgi:hypothetical protein
LRGLLRELHCYVGRTEGASRWDAAVPTLARHKAGEARGRVSRCATGRTDALVDHGRGRLHRLAPRRYWRALWVSACSGRSTTGSPSPRYRILGEVAAAAILWHYGLGWSFLHSGFEELVLTAAWVVGFTNAFNLMDNMEGAASTVAAVCAGGLALQSASGGDVGLAALALALAGACMGFLPYNLRRGAPARILLGDGGSMPIGFIVAALAMNIRAEEGLGWPVLVIGALLLGVPVLDTLLVVVSRTRRGVSLVTAGRDHLTHRLHMRLASPPVVAAALAVAQAAVSLLAVAAYRMGRTTIIRVALGNLGLGAAVVAVLDRPDWATGGRGSSPLAAMIRLPDLRLRRGPDRSPGGSARPRAAETRRRSAAPPVPVLRATRASARQRSGRNS